MPDRTRSRSPLVDYARFLPIPADAPVVTLGEGGTPLVRSEWFGPRLGIPGLCFKLEQTNPTGSFKDRFAACEVSLIRARGASVCMATSSGNTGSALAAYCARAGIRCLIFLTEHTPAGKLTQMLAHGAELFRVRGFGSGAETTARVFDELERLSATGGVPLIISAYQHCPDGMEGVKTISYEVAEQLGGLPRDLFVPIGAGGLCTAIARGFADLATEPGAVPTMPRIHAVQPAGNDTVVTSWQRGRESAQPVQSTTRISGLAVPMDLDGTRVLAAIRATGGSGILVDDDFVWEVQQDLCRHEGLYVEPAAAVAVAGLVQTARQGTYHAQGPTVCILTGHGFKDLVSIERMTADASVPLIEVSDVEATMKG